MCNDTDWNCIDTDEAGARRLSLIVFTARLRCFDCRRADNRASGRVYSVYRRSELLRSPPMRRAPLRANRRTFELFYD